MAETLSVQDMLPNKFEPKRKNRWIFACEGIDAFLIKTAARPTITIEEQEIQFMNSRRYVAGKANFDALSVTLQWVRTHFESVSGRAGYADFYKRDCQLKLVDPIGTVIELWDIKGCFLTNAGFGDLSYEDGAPMEISLTIRFDNCVLQY
jgi:hypothetical protein